MMHLFVSISISFSVLILLLHFSTLTASISASASATASTTAFHSLSYSQAKRTRTTHTTPTHTRHYGTFVPQDERQHNNVQSFLDQIESSLNNENQNQNQNFCSLLLNGPSKKNHEKDTLRGCIRHVQGRMILIPRKKKQQSTPILQLTIKYHGATDVVKNYDTPAAARIGIQALMLATASTDSDPEWGILQPMGSPLGIQSGKLVTTEWEYHFHNQQQSIKRLRINTNNSTTTTSTTTSAATAFIQPHDRTKQTVLPRQASFLQALGLTDDQGNPKPSKSAKVKQCQKFVEIVSQLIHTTMTTHNYTAISSTDMGCGRGYLTFSLHHYLNQYYPDITIQSQGIDVRPKLVNEMNHICTTLNINGLHFREGTIEEQGRLSSNSMIDTTTTTTVDTLNILIALHACDTATDDAIWYGLSQQQADIIVVAPCCHKQVRTQLDKTKSTTCADPSNIYSTTVLQHNIYRERMAEMVTDTMRALLIEIANYETSVFEFIGGEHTSKNVMITAVKRRTPRRSDKELDELRSSLKDLAALHGVFDQRLARWMEEDLNERASEVRNRRKLSKNAMPPL